MSNNTLAIFNPFALQSGSNQAIHSLTQEIIWYGESRFRQALLAIYQANPERQRWMQSVPLCRTDIYNILYWYCGCRRPGPGDPYFAALDVGPDPADLAFLADRYEYDWWNFDEAPKDENILNTGNLQTCLKTHRKYELINT
ncbi:hypothetical protein JOM56_014238 [Amanita muscaria]